MMIMMPMMILIRLVEAEKQTTAKKRPGLARNVGRLPFGCSPASDFYYLFHGDGDDGDDDVCHGGDDDDVLKPCSSVRAVTERGK